MMLSMMLGAAGFTNFASPMPTPFGEAEGISPGSAAAGIGLNANGTGTATNGGSFSWYQGAPPPMYVKVTVNSGSTPSGTIGSFVTIAGQAWNLSQSGTGSKTCSLNFAFSVDGVNTLANMTGSIQVIVAPA